MKRVNSTTVYRMLLVGLALGAYAWSTVFGAPGTGVGHGASTETREAVGRSLQRGAQ